MSIVRLPALLSLALGVMTALSSTLVAAQRSIPHRPSPASLTQRLNVVEFAFDNEVDATYQREITRLDQICGRVENPEACRANNLRPFSKLVARVRNAPTDAGAIVGELHAILGFPQPGELGYSIEFRPRDPRTRPVVWLRDVGDWGYGIEVAGVHIRGDWIQLFEQPFPAESWIDGRSPTFAAHAVSIEGLLVSLPSLVATGPDGVQRLISGGSYLIQRIRGSQVTFREEVATDFACGDDVKPPPVMPRPFRASSRAFFSDAGAPLFSKTYPRGC